ncbi:hypothetical protein GO684_04015 [Wolbachia endosymbiont of Litomosoides brasiliensis]|uniref:hypothetical protein n=1 Tax=Wolbachia endosymbiont of Litomosoides brasiliensis TaxID=1812117 RepID=UPI00158B5C72|nr:hypothetical protein [Wolbachia endosymbiont of Litomosoides brasiliensis]NUY39792.1 hypothetical protein [Wolbachia endosymbiont of Litomosoides brasiliensis]
MLLKTLEVILTVVRERIVRIATTLSSTHLFIGKVLMEGLAEYVTHLTEGEKPTDFVKLVGEEYKRHTLGR